MEEWIAAVRAAAASSDAINVSLIVAGVTVDFTIISRFFFMTKSVNQLRSIICRSTQHINQVTNSSYIHQRDIKARNLLVLIHTE